MRKLAAALLVAVAAFPALVGHGTPAAAAGSGASFTVAGGPTADLNLPPGQPVTVEYTVFNTSDQPEQIDVSITGLHFEGSTPEFTGSPSPGLSVSSKPTSMTLASQANQTVNVTAEAAPGTPPGGLYAGVVFKEIPPPSSGSATIQEAQARPLLGHVPGPTTDTGRIVSFASPTATAQPGHVVFDLTFLDTGRIDYRLGGSLSLETASGSVLGTIPVPAATVLPGNQRVVPLTYTGPAPAGQVTGRLHLTWGTTGEHSGTAMATVTLGGNGSGQASPPGQGGNQAGGQHHIVFLNRHRGHGVNWIFEGLALLLLLILIALLIKRYLQRRRTRKRLRREAAEAAARAEQ